MDEKYEEITKKYENILSCPIECNYGWLDIINYACRHISSRVVKMNYTDFKIIQIKEKFGSLRMYTASSDDYINGIVAMATSMSICVCEVCGNKGSTRTDKPWVRTLCNECYNKP
jgi:hypothetical protein